MTDDLTDNLNWVDTVEMLSLDTTSYLVVELGADGFYSYSLRDIARKLIMESAATGDEWEYYLDAMSDNAPHTFLQRVTSELGSDIAAYVEEWQYKIYRHMNKSISNKTYRQLLTLSREWDNSKLNQDVLLSGKDQTHIRMMIRNYISHYQNVRQEIYLLTKHLSEWDTWLQDLVENECYIGDTLPGILRSWHTKVLWQELINLLPKEQINTLAAYIQEVDVI
ncbi:MAG: hypothetical protein ABFD46_11735 [Armatimonadota bacterium]